MKKLLCLILTMAVIFTMASIGGPALAVSDEVYDVTLMAYSPGDADSPATKTLQKYAELLSDASEGRITLDVHHSGELGDSAAALASTQSGAIDITLVGNGYLAAVYEQVRLLNLPLLFESGEQACEVVNGEMGEQIFAQLPNVTLMFLAEGGGEMRQIAATKPIHTVKDVEGLPIAVGYDQLCADFWSTVAAAPSYAADMDVPTAFADGTIQAIDYPASQLVSTELYENVTDWSAINYMWSGSTMVINLGTWNNLPRETQQILKEQALEAVQVSIDATADAEQDALDVLEEEGLTLNMEPTVQSFRRAIGGDAYYERYYGSVWCYPEILTPLLDAID